MDLNEINEAPASSAEEARKRASKLITGNWPQIIAVFVAMAREGSVPHAKFLLEVSSLNCEKEKKAKEEVPEEEEKPKQSLAQLLLDTMCAFDRGELN